MPALRRSLIAVVSLGLIAGLAACGDDQETSKAESGTSTTTPTADSQSSYAIESAACFAEAAAKGSTDEDLRAALDCLSDDELIGRQRDYLELGTEATSEQVDCVEARLRELSRDELLDVSVSGIGEAVYVPCGLPD